MIEFLIWLIFAGYLLCGYVAVRRTRGIIDRTIVGALLFLPVVGWAGSHVVFRLKCHELAFETLRRTVKDVDGILFSSNWGTDTSWITWLVKEGGYEYADYPTRDTYERIYWEKRYFRTRRMSVADSPARYEIHRSVTTLYFVIHRNDFIARDRSSGEELGRKTVLFMPAGPVSQVLYFIFTIRQDAGGYSCPAIRQTEDLFRFFPGTVLLPKPRA